MSLSISATAATVQQTAAPFSASTVQAATSVTASTPATPSDAPIADTVSITNALVNALAPYKSNGSGLVQSQNFDYATAVASGSAATVAYGGGGVPAATAAVPVLDGEGAPGDGSTTEFLNYQSTSTQGTVTLTNGIGPEQAGVVAEEYKSLAITDTTGRASVSLSSKLSGVKAQSTVGDLTLQLGQALQADTTTDPTTGAISLTNDGKTNLITIVTQLLLAKDFTSDEAANGAQSLADSIDGTSKTITLSLQHNGDQTDIRGGASTLSYDPEANQLSNDHQSDATINISLDTGTGNLTVGLDYHEVDREEGAFAQHSGNVAQVLASVSPVRDAGAGGQDIQSAAGSVLQETASTSRFTSNQSTLSVTLDNGGVSAELSSTSIQGRLRSQDISEAAAVGQASQKALDSDSSTVAGLFDAVDTPSRLAAVAGTNPATEPTPAAVSKTAPALSLSSGTSPFITALNGALQLLQSVKPVPVKTRASSTNDTPAGNAKLQSVSTSQEGLTVTEGSSKDDITQQLGENNAYLAALYFAPSAAKPNTDLSA